MKTCLLKSQLLHHFLPIQTNLTSPKSFPVAHHKITTPNYGPFLRNPSLSSANITCQVIKSHQHHEETTLSVEKKDAKRDGLRRRLVITGAASLGFMLLMMGHDKAWALGPEGPLMEEFWENVRRYALYALTVSTGVLYAVFQPIFELLKNPISAVLVLIIIGGTFYIGSQVLYAMVGISDFSYQYAY